VGGIGGLDGGEEGPPAVLVMLMVLVFVFSFLFSLFILGLLQGR
jgi:hypothetical protein